MIPLLFLYNSRNPKVVLHIAILGRYLNHILNFYTNSDRNVHNESPYSICVVLFKPFQFY